MNYCEHILKAAKQLASGKTLKSLAISAITAGATAGLGASFDINLDVTKAEGFVECAAIETIKSLTSNVVKASFGERVDPLDALVNICANSIGAYGAKQIGGLYKDNKVNFVEHKALHMGAGALTGAMMGGANGALSGAIAAGAAATVMDSFRPSDAELTASSVDALEAQGLSLSTENLEMAACEQLEVLANLSKFSGTLAAFVTGQDVAIADHIASTTIDNNCLPLAIAAIIAGFEIYSKIRFVIEMAQTAQIGYNEDGIKGAAKACGIKIVEDAVLAKALGFAGSSVYYVGKIALPTIGGAFKTVFKLSPTLKNKMGDLGNKLGSLKDDVCHKIGKFKDDVYDELGRIKSNVGFGQPAYAGAPDGSASIAQPRSSNRGGINSTAASSSSADAASSSSAAAAAAPIQTSKSSADNGRIALEKHGKKPISEMSDHEFVQSIANRADRISSEKGSVMGTRKHQHAEELAIRYQDRTGDRRHLELEQRYIRGDEWKQGDGLKGSVKPDVYDPTTGTVWDYKFGNAQLQPSQVQRLEARMPKLDGQPVTVNQIKPNGGQ